jgi:putative hydrolase of the HAD superfamily
MGVAELFDTVVLSVDLGWRKPHPAVYRAALERMGIQATDAIFVGDTYIADYVGPRAAGMRALLIDPGGTADIPGEDRLHTIVDLTERVRDHRR